jgi:sterol desaturase/sphingolipid hydroxylase (fatty acid hydroxylase superfamily)
MELVSKEFQIGALAVILAFVLAEVAWAIRKKKQIYHWKEVMANMGIMLGNQLLKPIRLAWALWLFSLAEPYRLLDIPSNAYTYAFTIIFVDFYYYWHHRFSHEVKALWALHNVHHSSPWMNLTTSFRLNWLGGFVGPILFLPIVFVGLPAKATALFFALNLLYQFFLHTEAVGKLPWVEGWLNTPAAHRVHHGSNARYIDKNYGGMLMVWDRLFGTYEPETETVQYGVTTGFEGHNPVKLVLAPVYRLFFGGFKREREANLERSA